MSTKVQVDFLNGNLDFLQVILDLNLKTEFLLIQRGHITCVIFTVIRRY